MHGELLILFVILLLGLILCSFLGGTGCVEGMENGQYYYSPNGDSAIIKTDSDGNHSLAVTTSAGTTTTYTASKSDTYIGPNGATATVKQDEKDASVIQVKDSNGNNILTLTSKPNKDKDTSKNDIINTNYDNYNHYDKTSYPSIFYGPNGGTAKVIQTPNNNIIVITNKNGSTEIYDIDKNSSDTSVSKYYGPNGGSAKMITDSNGKNAVEITTPNGSKIVYKGDNIYTYDGHDDTINQYDANSISKGSDINASSYYGPHGGQSTTINGPSGNTYSTYDSSAYYNTLPQGVSRSEIPAGQEDLYILKSQVVPPVCPKCPDPIVKSSDEPDLSKIPPCPPCKRCPEPNFSCEKVPNYKAFNPDTMPVPVLTDFSGFGM